MQLTWYQTTFSNLTTLQLYEVLRLRAKVFVVEQNCVYQDLDDKDQQAVHLLGRAENGELAAYSRLVDKGVSYPDYASIGRVITAPFARGKGLGRPLMQESIRALFDHFGQQSIKIGAQAHLQKYYGSLGFVGVGEVYDEDGIPHRSMVYSPIDQ
ncbi:MAG: GNAT family N-acetyltransferase [Lewinella sp.]